MMRRICSVAAGVALALAATVVPASADSLATGYAAAATVSPGTGMAPTVATSGELAGLLDFLTPVFDDLVTPLTSALTALPDAAVETVAGVVRDQDATAATTATPAVDGNNFPDCGDADWSSGNCYRSQLSTPDAAVTLGIDDARGFAGDDGASSTAGARTSGITMTALGLQVASVGDAQSRMTCDAQSACTGSSSFDNASLLDGAVQMKTDDDSTLLVSLGNGDYRPVDQLDSAGTVSYGSRQVAVTPSGGGVQLSIPLSLQDLLAALGVPDTLDALDAAGDGSTITLDVIVSPGETGAQQGALQIGVGIAADIHLSVLGLSDIAITMPDTPSGNLMSLEFAYTAAKNSSGTTSDPVTGADLK